MNSNTVRLIATACGLGRLPMPGTLSSASLFAFWFFVGIPLPQAAEVMLYIILLVMITWATLAYCRQVQYRDLPEIVGDEMLAVLIIILWLPPVWYLYLLAFIIFRILDIWKPFGIKKLEKIPGARGIIVDDLAAAIITIIIIMLIPIV